MITFDRDEAILAELLASDSTPPIPESFRRALWAELVAAHTAAAGPRPVPMARTAGPVGLPGPVRVPRVPSLAPLQMAATAALVVLSLVGLLALHSRAVPAPGSPPPLERPDAALAEPALLQPGGPADEVLLRRLITSASNEVGWIRMEIYRKEAGATWTTGTAESTGIGPMVYQIQEGGARVEADQPVEVTRSGLTSAVRTAALSPGDELFVPAGVRVDWRNDADVPVTYLDAGLTTAASLQTCDAPLHSVGEHQVVVSATGDVPRFYKFGLTLPFELAVRRIVVPPGGAIPNPAPETRAWAAAGSGTMEVDWARQDTPGVPTGSHRFSAFSSTQISGDEIVGTTLRNVGETPLVLLVFTVTPVPAAASP